MAKQKDNNEKSQEKPLHYSLLRGIMFALGTNIPKSYFNRQDLIVFVSGEIRRIISIGAKNVSYI